MNGRPASVRTPVSGHTTNEVWGRGHSGPFGPVPRVMRLHQVRDDGTVSHAFASSRRMRIAEIAHLNQTSATGRTLARRT
jgi:hypothetical protein